MSSYIRVRGPHSCISDSVNILIIPPQRLHYHSTNKHYYSCGPAAGAGGCPDAIWCDNSSSGHLCQPVERGDRQLVAVGGCWSPSCRLRRERGILMGSTIALKEFAVLMAEAAPPPEHISTESGVSPLMRPSSATAWPSHIRISGRSRSTPDSLKARRTAIGQPSRIGIIFSYPPSIPTSISS